MGTHHIRKSVFLLILSTLLMLFLCSCNEPSKVQMSSLDTSAKASASDAKSTRIFVDSLSREVTVPEAIDKVAVTGVLSQIGVFALCPDKLVALSAKWPAKAAAFIDDKYQNLPVIGQIYGSKNDCYPEMLLAMSPDIVIDFGESKESMADDLDELSQKYNIPFVHIDANLSTTDKAYEMLGDLMGLEEEAKVLSDYCRKCYEQIETVSLSCDKKSAVCITSFDPLCVVTKGSFHSECIDLLTDNVAVSKAPSSMGTGSETDIEQLISWNPEVIIISTDQKADSSIRAKLKNIDALKNNHCYYTPIGPYNWMGFPPSVQRYLGLMWLTDILYPNETNYDMFNNVKEYYELFYHHELTKDEYDTLVTDR